MAAATESIEVNAPIEKVFQVITDYERYPGMFNEVKTVEVLKRTPKKAVVKFQVKYVKSFSYTLEFTFKKPEEVTWVQIEGDFKDNRGSWKLEKKGKNKTFVTYSAELDFGFFVPKGILNRVIQVSLPAMLKRFKEEAEKA